ncbi:MAG: AzlD domain-containing protein [Clostridia bacterium]|nr:AzlD domain-containing protein [Clostridia bacterium]
MTMDVGTFFLYLLVCAGVTYLIRTVPLLLIKHQIRNRFIRSLIYYIPFAVLTVMTIPAVLYSTDSMWSAIAGLVVALVLAYFNFSLLIVSLSACGTVLCAELLMRYVFHVL